MSVCSNWPYSTEGSPAPVGQPCVAWRRVRPVGRGIRPPLCQDSSNPPSTSTVVPVMNSFSTAKMMPCATSSG